MDRNRKPGIYLLTDTGKEIDLTGVIPDGKQQSLCGLPPVMELVNFVNFDFSACRTCEERLCRSSLRLHIDGGTVAAVSHGLTVFNLVIGKGAPAYPSN